MTGYKKRKSKKKFLIAGFLAILVAGGQNGCLQNLATLANAKPLAQIAHERLFNAFLPINKLPLTEQQKNQLADIEQATWAQIQNKPAMLSALSLLAFDPYLRPDNGHVEPDEHILSLLRVEFPWLKKVLPTNLVAIRDSIPKTIFNLRFYYLSRIYGSSFGHELANFEENAKPFTHPNLDAFMRTFREQTASLFNPGGIVFDPATKQIKPTVGEFDYAIIGSGTAGSVLASELATAGYKVIVLESGSFPVPGAIDGTRNNLFYESENLRFSENGQVLTRNAKVAGGGSTVNVDLAFPPTFSSIRARLERWRKAGLIPYSESDINSANEWIEKKIGTIPLTEADINANNRVLWDGSKKLGWEPSLYRLNRYPEQNSPYPVSSKASSLEKMLIPAMVNPQNPLYLVTDAQVQSIEFEEHGQTHHAKKILIRQGSPLSDTGVITDPMRLAIPPGTLYSVAAQNMILSAGALGSPAVLLRSKANQFNAQIGKSIVLHPSFPLISEFEKPIHNNLGLTESVFNDHFALMADHGYILEAMAGTPDYGAFMLFDRSKNIFNTIVHYQNMAGFGVMLVDASHEENYLTIDDAGNPVVHYELNAHDAERFRNGILSTAEAAFAAGAKRVAAPSIEMPNASGGVFFDTLKEFQTALAKLEFKPYQTVITSAHLQASLSMGNTPENSAVDLESKLRGVDNLYVMDASIFPESIGANPMQSIYTFAHLLAQRLINAGHPLQTTRLQ